MKWGEGRESDKGQNNFIAREVTSMQGHWESQGDIKLTYDVINTIFRRIIIYWKSILNSDSLNHT